MLISGANSCKSCIIHNPDKIIEIFVNIEKQSVFAELIEQNKLNNKTKLIKKNDFNRLGIKNDRFISDIVIRREKYKPSNLEEIIINTKKSLIIIADQITDQNNLGNIIRTALLMGADGLLLSEHSSADINDVTSLTSSGAVEVLKYHISKNIAFKLNGGLYHQFLTTANNQDENLRLVELWLGIPEDKPAANSQHLISGLEYMSPKNIFYRCEIYHKRFDNLLTLKQENRNTIESDDSESPFNEFWDTRRKAKGVEFLMKKSSGRFNGWVGYTYAKTEYYAEPSGWHHPNFDRTHTLNMVGNIELTNELEISTAITQSSGNPFTKILGRAYDWEQNLDSETYWYPVDSYIVGEKNTERYDNYFRVDIGMTRKNGNLFGLKYNTYWQIMNVSRHLNIFTYAYRTKRDINTGNQLGVERRAVPMFPMIFTFGVRFDF